MPRRVLRGYGFSLLATVSALALYSQGVLAQDAAPPAPASSAGKDQVAQDSGPVEQVTVTGSLISNPSFAAPTAVTAISADTIQQREAGTVFEVIKDIPAFNTTSGPSANSTGAQNASKANLNLRNLGSTRTLVLINGERHVPDGATNVFDTNLIPASLVKRIDIVTGGASATYGSDAVAGVVNFILDNHYEGFKGDVHFGISQYGDNIEFAPSLTYGTSLFGGRGHFIAGGDVTINEGTPNMYARGWGRLEPGVMSTPAVRPVGMPAQLVSNHVETVAYNASGLIVSGPLKNTVFGENGTTSLLQLGSVVGSTEMIGTGDYRSVENPDQFLKAAYDRGGLLTRFDYDVNDSTVAYAQFMYGGLRTFGDSFGAQVPNFNKYTVFTTNPFLPPQVVAALTAAGQASFQYSASRQVDLGSISSRNRTDSMEGNVGISGEFSRDWLGGPWDWDAELGVGAAAFVPFIKNTPRTADFFESAYVVKDPATGQPVCGPVATNPYFNAQPAAVKAQLIANLSPGCVPYDIFGNNVAANQAANRYFNSASNADFEFRQYTFNLGFTGNPLSLPAGDVSLAFGYDWRRDAINVVNCADCMKGALMNQNYSHFFGDILVNEVYAETDIPVIKDVFLLEKFGINAAVRNTDYSTSGNVTTWKIGFTWDVSDDWRLRGTRSHDIRAPNVNELFNPGSEGNPNVQNKVKGTSGFIKSNTIGNPNLLPETGETWTGGVVYEPQGKFLQGMSASVDYYWIKMSKVISTLPIQTLLDDYNVKGASSIYAQYVTADPSNVVGVSRVNVPQLNLNSLKTDGVDMEIDYAVPEEYGLPGSLSVRAVGGWIDQFKTVTPTSTINSVRTASAPRMSWNISTNYKIDAYSFNLQAHYTSPTLYDPTLVGLDGLTPGTALYNATAALSNSINRNLWPGAITWNGSFAYDVLEDSDHRLQAYLNIDNIANKQPPIVAISIGGSAYDLVGRSFKIGLRFSY
jgi:outer membrane receptor protein involved in Fe transport